MTRRRATSAAAGFTLVELLVVMSILLGFMVMLVQFIDSGTRIVQGGEEGQALADRAAAAHRSFARELAQLRGPGLQLEPGAPQSRLLLQQPTLAFLRETRAEHHDRMPLLRATVSLPEDVEQRMVDQQLIGQIAATQQITPERVDLARAETAAAFAELRASHPLRGVGNAIWFCWPSAAPDAADGSLLELRMVRLLPGEQITTGTDSGVDPMHVPLPGDFDLPGPALKQAGFVLIDRLLHVGVRCWAQDCTAWERADTVWDSARGGWLGDPATSPTTFRFDLGPLSLQDPSDDVFPAALQITLVVAQDPNLRPEGLLAGDLDSGARVLELQNPDRFPGPDRDGWVKIGAEWMRYAELSGSELRGLRRGERGTQPRRHQRGSVLRLGRTVEFVVPFAGAKEDWNGNG